MKNKDVMDLVITEEGEEKKVDYLSTGVVTLNLLFSGKVDGGIPIGKISQMTAPPSLGKSFVALSLIKNAQKKGMYVVFVDTEGAFDFKWAKSVGIDVDQSKLMVIQENMIEDVQKALLNIVKDIPRDERRNIFYCMDSFGNLVTDKTMSDAEKGKDVKDMTITTKKNTLARLLLTTKATVFVVNHTYANIGGYGDPTKVPGGQVLYHNCSAIVLAKTKAKEENADKEITGQLISCVAFKARGGIEKSETKFRIKHNGGLDIFYGILPDALEHGCVEKSGNMYLRPHIKNDKKVWEKNMYVSEFWMPIFKGTDFMDFLQKKYSFEGRELDVSKMEITEELNKKEKASK